MTKIFLSILYLISVLFFTGCSQQPAKDWTTIQKSDKVVWASDGTEVAIILVSYEEQTRGYWNTTTEQRHFKYKILTQKFDGAEQRAITDWIESQPVQLFYMKEAGYLVVESLVEHNKRRFDKITLEGTIVPIVEERQPYQPCAGTKLPLKQVSHQVIPSPAGEQLIEVYSPECGQVTVEFLQAHTLNIIDNQTFTIDQPMTALWSSDNTVILVSTRRDKAWKFAAQTPPVPIDPPLCVAPITSSNQVSLDGRLVYFEGEQLKIKNIGRHKSFGC